MGTYSLPLVFKESGSTSRVDNPLASISECLISWPEELITEILVRLPVKSLLRFKCVSKPWLSLISNPQFIRYHLSRSSSMEAEADSSSLNLELLFATNSSMVKCSLYSALHEAHPSMHFDGNEFMAQNTYPIVGIINGLVCLNVKGTDLCVWNPALNKIKHLNVFPEAPRPVTYSFSFGYDESNDDYKVVCLQTAQVDPGVFDTEVCIYSLKADSWRRIDQLKGFIMNYPGVFADGKIYWPGPLFAPSNRKYVSLDMSTEKFVELEHPEYDPGNCLLKMGVSGGRLFVYCSSLYKEKNADLWVLDKRGVEESWCKLVSIPYTDVNRTLWHTHHRVLCILSNGEIVFGSPNGLFVYNWKKKECRNIYLFQVVGITTDWRIAAYVESLVWPTEG